MHVLHNLSALCMINMYDKLNMLIIVCYNLYFVHNIGRKVKLFVFKEKIKFKKRCLFSINFHPFCELRQSTISFSVQKS